MKKKIFNRKNAEPIALVLTFVLTLAIVLVATLLNQGTSGNNIERPKLNVQKPYPAPALDGVSVWLGTIPPQAQDKATLIWFWSYTTPQSLHEVEFLNKLYEKYNRLGLAVIGIHSPQFQFENNPDQFDSVLKSLQIKFPVGIDADFEVWRDFQNSYWPTSYFIDSKGRIVDIITGEGNFHDKEEIVRYLLNQAETDLENIPRLSYPEINFNQEAIKLIYLGLKRQSGLSNIDQEIRTGSTIPFQAQTTIDVNKWELEGTWTIADEYISPAAGEAKLRYKFSGSKLSLLVGSDKDTAIEVRLNDQPASILDWAGEDIDVRTSSVTVGNPRFYQLVRLKNDDQENTIAFTVPTGVRLYLISTE